MMFWLIVAFIPDDFAIGLGAGQECRQDPHVQIAPSVTTSTVTTRSCFTNAASSQFGHFGAKRFIDMDATRLPAPDDDFLDGGCHVVRQQCARLVTLLVTENSRRKCADEQDLANRRVAFNATK
jgi:hypothetical protein